MQTREEAMSMHPAGKALTAPVEEPKGPYRAFFDALDDLELAITVYGTGSVEADMARATVRRHRADAAGAWRNHSVSAA